MRIITIITLVFTAFSCSFERNHPPLVHHTVKTNEDLGHKGKRIGIYVTNKDISLSEAENLLNHYVELGKPNGQISVWKYSSFFKLDQPWIVYNYDGKPATVNANFFPKKE